MSDEAKPYTMKDLPMHGVTDTGTAWSHPPNARRTVATIRELEAAQKRIAELEAKSAPIPGVTDGSRDSEAYTLDDVDRIEAVRGKPYARLRVTAGRIAELEAEIEKWKDSVSLIMREAEVEHRKRSDERDEWKAKAEAAEASAAMLRETLRKVLWMAESWAASEHYGHPSRVACEAARNALKEGGK